MKYLLGAVLFIPLIAGACDPSQIQMTEAYVRAVPSGQVNTAAYLDITNTCDRAMDIISVSSPAASKVELHEVVDVGGVAKMQHLETINLPPHVTTVLAPGALHLMLLGLQQPLQLGDSISVKFNFRDGSSKTLAFPIKDIRQDTSHQHQHQH